VISVADCKKRRSTNRVVLSATPIDINRIMTLSKPVKRVFYDIEEEKGSPFKEIIHNFIAEIHV
jgi:predicted GTPase